MLENRLLIWFFRKASEMLVPSERTVSWLGRLKVLLLLMSMLMVVKQK